LLYPIKERRFGQSKKTPGQTCCLFGRGLIACNDVGLFLEPDFGQRSQVYTLTYFAASYLVLLNPLITYYFTPKLVNVKTMILRQQIDISIATSKIKITWYALALLRGEKEVS